jgi:hypothetical protein
MASYNAVFCLAVCTLFFRPHRRCSARDKGDSKPIIEGPFAPIKEGLPGEKSLSILRRVRKTVKIKAHKL